MGKQMIGNERVAILVGTDHKLQGAGQRAGNIEDPLYLELIKRLGQLMGLQVDTIFEEASGLGPTTAEKLSIQSGMKYHDVDPHVDKRYIHGLSRDTGEWLNEPFSSVLWTKHEAQLRREDFWTKKISSQPFQVALMICGSLHTLSLAGKLSDAGFEVYAHCYVPYDKFCRLDHSTTDPPVSKIT
jgi:hypothetical protein